MFPYNGTDWLMPKIVVMYLNTLFGLNPPRPLPITNYRILHKRKQRK